MATVQSSINLLYFCLLVQSRLLLTGSVVVRKTARGHDVHLGKLGGVDVGSVATGMGCPSVDIIVTELIKLGAKRFIRVGTAGSVQPKDIRVGSVVIGTGGVRDEGTSRNYAPPEFPAVASPLLVLALQQAAREMGIAENVYSGIIHAKVRCKYMQNALLSICF